jgi:putative acetyltransferase
MRRHAVRLYEARDAEAVSSIFRNAVEGLAPKSYTPDQVAAWAARGVNADLTHKRCSDGRHVWVATDEQDKAVAFIDLEANGHIDMLFCHPTHAGQGVASKLFQALISQAETEKIETLTTEASAVAQPVFMHWGFETVRRNDFERNGVAMFNFSMVKYLGVE